MSEEDTICRCCDNPLPSNAHCVFSDCERCDNPIHPQCAGIIDGDFICIECLKRLKAQIDARLNRERKDKQ